MEDSNDGDSSKKATDVTGDIEEEKQEMTLEEYEKMLSEKKSLVPSGSVERKLDPAFEGLNPLEKKRRDEDKIKLENVRREAWEIAAKYGQAPKLNIHELLKQADGTGYVPPLPPLKPDGPKSGSYRGGRGDRSYNVRGSSSESQVYNTGHVNFQNVDASNGNGAPRRDRYQQRREGGYQLGGYNRARNNGVYQQGGNQERRQGGYEQGGGGGPPGLP